MGYCAGFRFLSHNVGKCYMMELTVVPVEGAEIPEKYKNGLTKEDIKIYLSELKTPQPD